MHQFLEKRRGSKRRSVRANAMSIDPIGHLQTSFLPASKSLLVFFALFIIAISSPDQNALAQDQSGESGANTDFALKYEVRKLKLEMIWADLYLHESFSTLVELKQFADEAAEDGEFELATIYMDEIFDLAETGSTNGKSNTESTVQTGATVEEKLSSLSKAIIFGLDFSEQRYSLNFGLSDSSYIDNQNNPFSGFRIDWNHYRPNHHDMRLSTQLKYSRDYTTWEVLGNFKRTTGFGSEIKYNQKFDGLSYQRTFPIQYWQSYSEVSVEQRLYEGLAFRIYDGFQFRRYADESSSFPTNWRNELRTSLSSTGIAKGTLLVDYSLDQRWQRTYREYDYGDQRVGMQYSIYPSWQSSVLAWYQYRDMNYIQATPDSSFLSDFTQHYASVNLKLHLYRGASIRFAGEGILRDHPVTALYTPDFAYFRIEPGLSMSLSDQATIGAGYLMEVKEYRKTVEQNSSLLLSEDLYAQGVVVSFDYFNYRNLLFTLSHTFRLNSYPDAILDPVPGFSIYTDRIQNSTLMYLSYKLWSALEITLVVQHDLDIDREIDHNDSRSAIFSLDFAWEF